MPRRNRNAHAFTVSPGMLADQAAHIAAHLAQTVPCAGCRASPATEGGYCALCKGLIVLFARRAVLERR
jgi:hypothetical protein